MTLIVLFIEVRRRWWGVRVLDALRRALYLIFWLFGLFVVAWFTVGSGLMCYVLVTVAIGQPVDTTFKELRTILLDAAPLLAIWILGVIGGLISPMLKRSAKVSDARAGRTRALLGGMIAFVIYGLAGGAETAALGLSLNGYFRAHVFDAATLAALVTFGWLLVPTEKPQRPGLRKRLRAYGYFAVACAGIAGLGSYTAGGSLRQVGAFALSGAFAGWLLALGVVASTWPQSAREKVVTTAFRFTVPKLPKEVFAAICDAARHPEWVGGLVQVDPGPGRPSAGAVGREIWRILPYPIRAPYEVISWESGRCWASQAVTPHLHFKRQIQLATSNGGSARVAVELQMIGKGFRGLLLVWLFGQPWRVHGLGDEDRLRRILGVPSRAEKETHVSVDWSRFPRLLPFAGTLRWLRGMLSSPDIVNGHKDREGPSPS